MPVRFATAASGPSAHRNDGRAADPPSPRRREAGGGGTVAIVVPAYQEAATIADIVRRARAAAPPGALLLVVDDGSSDGTAALAAAAGAEVLRAGTNGGKGAALRRGMREALARGARLVVTLDGDGQHRPEDIPRLLAAAARARPPGRSIVIGSRRAAAAAAPGAQPGARRHANRVADFWISWAAGQAIVDSQSGFRVYPAEALARLDRYDRRRARGFAFESEILIDAARHHGCRTVAVEIPALYGAALRRPSHFKPVADIARIVMMVAGKLLVRGMHPRGLARSLAQRRRGIDGNAGERGPE